MDLKVHWIYVPLNKEVKTEAERVLSETIQWNIYIYIYISHIYVVFSCTSL